VIGAGPWGLATAWQAAGRGARVTVLDDGRPPAAEVAAGLLGHLSEAADGDATLDALSGRAAEAWPAWAGLLEADSGRDPGFRTTGAVLVASRPEHVPAVRGRLETLARCGRRVEWLSGSALRALEPGLGPDVAGGADLPEEHQAEPRRLLAALRAACAARGVALAAGRARALLGASVAEGAALDDGSSVRAGRVVLAAGWDAGALAARVPVRPVKGQILRLRAAGDGPLPLTRAVRSPSVYLAPREREVVVGATSEERPDTTVTAEGVHLLLDEALRVAPGLGELELAEARAGLRPTTPDGLPALGPDPDVGGLVWAVGGYRHGILLAPLAAQAAGAAVAGEPLPAWAGPLAPGRFAGRGRAERRGRRGAGGRAR
jgi:glycine oxidase